MSKLKCNSAFGITVNADSNHKASIFHKLMKQRLQLSVHKINVDLRSGVFGLTKAAVN